MTHDKIFALVYRSSHGGDEATYLFQGPSYTSEAEFQVMCNSLIGEAVYAAEKEMSKTGEESYIGYGQVVKSLASLLAQKGYMPFFPKTAEFLGSPVLDEEDLMDDPLFSEEERNLIIKYNQTIDEKYTPTDNDDIGLEQFEEELTEEDVKA